MTTVLGQLVAKSEDVDGYITYVFKILDEENVKYAKSPYLMLIQYYNWVSNPIQIGEKGFVKYKEVEGGVDTWWDGEQHHYYKQDDCVFYKFIPIQNNYNCDIIL